MTVAVTFDVPVPARARKAPTGKWRPGYATRPVTCELPEVTTDPDRAISWGDVRFRVADDTLHAFTSHAWEATLPQQLVAWQRDGVLGLRGCCDPAIQRALSFPLTRAQVTSFQNLVGYHQDAGRTADAVAGKGIDLEVDELDVDAVRSLLESRLVVGDGTDLLWRPERPHAVLCTNGGRGLHVEPSTKFDVGNLVAVPFDRLDGSRMDDVAVVARVQLTDGVDWESLVPHMDGHPNDLRDPSAFLVDGPVAPPPTTPEARRWAVESVSRRLAAFSHEAIRTYLDERDDIDGSDPVAGEHALVRVLDAWSTEPIGARHLDTLGALTAFMRARAAVAEARAELDATFDSFGPAPGP